MIWESSFWKEPLIHSASYLARVRMSERTRVQTLVRIEKEFFLGFYAIRKLIEARKVSDHLKTLPLDLSFYKSRREVSLINWHHVGQNYSLTKELLEGRDLMFLCNQVIHSIFFVTSEQNGRLNGFFIASDREFYHRCFFVRLAQVLTIFRSVGRNYPANSEFSRNLISRQITLRIW